MNKFLIIIIVLIIIIYYKYINQSVDRNYDLEYTQEPMRGIDSGVLTPIQKSPTKKLNYNEAIVVYGNIPHKYIYWGIIGCEHRENNFEWIADSISSRSISGASGTRIAAVLTQNEELFKAIKKQMVKEMKPTGYLCMVIPLYVLCKDREYTILTQTVIENENEEIPRWECRVYKSPNVKRASPEIGVLIPYSTFSELTVMSESEWQYACSQLLIKKGMTNYLKIDTYVSKSNNRDITSFETDFVQLLPNEFLFVIAIDHTKFGKATYSFITDGYITNEITGDSRNMDSQVNKYRFLLRFITFKNSCQIREFIYMDPSTKDCIGPSPDSVHRMQVFKVSHC